MAISLSLTASLPLRSPWSPRLTAQSSRSPSSSLFLLAGSRTGKSNLSMNEVSSSATHLGSLHSSFLFSPSSLSSLSNFSSSSGLFSGYSMYSNLKVRKRRGGLVVRAGKAALCLTKRSRSRKSLARTHGFRRRMRTTSGRAVLKRRRAKGRWVLCTKTHPNSGK